jgi:coenzyme F420-0:L-glutamate ligase/coenzyme F420-1:gamma-L-glutamate ligase
MATSLKPRAVRQAVELFGLSTDEVVDPSRVGGLSAAEYFVALLETNGMAPRDGDILAVSSKITSFHEGGAVRLSDVRPSRKARILGRLFRKDPRKLQVLMETGRVTIVIPMCWIVRMRRLWQMLETTSKNPAAMRRAFRRANGVVATLPKDPCGIAARIRAAVRERFTVDVAVIVTDTAAKLGRVGSNDVAIGYAGMDPITRLTFSDDLFGVPRSGGVDIVIDSVAAMAGLVMGQTTEMTPAVLVRGVAYEPERSTGDASGMEALTYPRGTLWRSAALTLLATVAFFLANLLTFQFWPRRTRA